MLYNEALDVISLDVTPLDDHKKMCSSWEIYVVLFAIFFITSICIIIVFIYFHWYLKKIMLVLSLVLVLRQQFIKNRNENIKQINIKNRTYYFFNHMNNIKKFDPSLIKIDNKSYKNTGIYYIGYITVKRISDYENINSINPLYLIIGEVDGYIIRRRFIVQMCFRMMLDEVIYWRITAFLRRKIIPLESASYSDL